MNFLNTRKRNYPFPTNISFLYHSLCIPIVVCSCYSCCHFLIFNSSLFISRESSNSLVYQFFFDQFLIYLGNKCSNNCLFDLYRDIVLDHRTNLGADQKNRCYCISTVLKKCVSCPTIITVIANLVSINECCLLSKW